MVTWPSGKARVCKTLIHQFKSGRHLQKIPGSCGFRDFLFCTVPRQTTRLTPPFVTCGDIFPRSGGSLSSKGESPAKPVTLQLSRKVCRSAALSQKAALQMLLTITTPPVKMQCRSVRRRSGIALLKIILPLIMARAQRRRPPPAAETGRSCWGSGQQDASAAQGTKRMLGAATR